MNVSAITSSVANSIVSYRTENGEFKTLEDLLNKFDDYPQLPQCFLLALALFRVFEFGN